MEDKTNGDIPSYSYMLPAELPPVWTHVRAPELLHSRTVPFATYAPWLSDREFAELYERIKDSTLVDKCRCYELWDLAKQTDGIEGAILEVGAWRGGTGCVLAKAAPRKAVFLADTFAGVVKVGDKDTSYVDGAHSDTTADHVRTLLASVEADNVRILQGTFPDETAHLMADEPLALLHVDVDTYQSAMDVVQWALPRIPCGGVIVFDDYGVFGIEGITRAVNELRASLKGFRFCYNLNGHALLVRTGEAG